jgi:hypothetical protein
MNPAILQAITIPVLMLMIRDMEFHKNELTRDGHSTTNIDEAIKAAQEVLTEKTA